LAKSSQNFGLSRNFSTSIRVELESNPTNFIKIRHKRSGYKFSTLVPIDIKVRSPIPSVYAGFYIVYYKDIGEFQILYSQDICW
jgi:hypothetical protein